MRRLQEHFDLKHFGGLCKAKQDADDTEDSESDADPHPHEAEEPPQEPQPEPQQEPLEEPEAEGQQECQVLKQQVQIMVDSIIMTVYVGGSRRTDCRPQEEDEEVLSATSDEISGEPNAFCIQFFFSEKNYEIR